MNGGFFVVFLLGLFQRIANIAECEAISQRALCKPSLKLSLSTPIQWAQSAGLSRQTNYPLSALNGHLAVCKALKDGNQI